MKKNAWMSGYWQGHKVGFLNGYQSALTNGRWQGVISVAAGLLLGLVVLVVLYGCQPYPAQSKVLKQDTNRYNEMVGR
jgi:hypothetical protein